MNGLPVTPEDVVRRETHTKDDTERLWTFRLRLWPPIAAKESPKTPHDNEETVISGSDSSFRHNKQTL